MTDITATLEWLRFYKTLAAAQDEYSRRNLRIDGGRSAAIKALKGVLEYIGEVDGTRRQMRWRPEPFEVEVPLQALLRALEDLDNGAVAPILRPADRDGRPPNTFDRRMIMKEAAETMRVLMRIGYTGKEAADSIAELLREIGFSLAGGRNVSGRTVEKWWDQLQRTSDPLRVPIWEGTERKAFSLKERAQIRNDILYLLLITFLRFGELKNGGPSATEFLHRWQIRK